MESLAGDRGFGFIKNIAQGDRYFFHVTSCLTGRRDFLGMAEGSQVLFQLGSSPRRSQQRCAVRWAHVPDLEGGEFALPDDQPHLDTWRREALRGLALHDLQKRVEADWYVRQWSGSAPADLSEPVLGEVWRDKLAALHPENLRDAGLPEMLAR